MSTIQSIAVKETLNQGLENLQSKFKSMSKTSIFVISLLSFIFLFLIGGMMIGDDKETPKLNQPEAVPTSYQAPVTRSMVKSDVKARPAVPKRPSKRSKQQLDGDSQEIVYRALEASTRAYITSRVGVTLADKYEFDADGKVQLAISEYFRLSEEKIIAQFKNKIINTAMLDTIRNDTLDLRMIVYK